MICACDIHLRTNVYIDSNPIAHCSRNSAIRYELDAHTVNFIIPLMHLSMERGLKGLHILM